MIACYCCTIFELICSDKAMSSTAVHCKVCNVKFESNRILLAHINLHIGRKCKNCNKFFKSTIAENVLNSYDNKCKESHIWISKQSLLKQSEPSPPPTRTIINNTPKYVRKYTPDEILQCQYCSYSTHCNTRFKKHMRCHTNERPYKCDKCDKAFTVRCNLKQHISSVHTKEKKFKCKHCGRGFIRSDRLKEHERTHTGEKPLKCPFCEQHFATSGRLNKHKKKHTGYKCRFCTKVYKTEYQLKQHKKAEHAEIIGDKPSNYIIGIRWFPHGCNFCGLRFLEKSLLEVHIKEHNGKICGKCDKLFDSKDKMKQHQGTCTGPVEVPKKEIDDKLKAQTKIRSNKLLKLAVEGKEHYCLDCNKCFPSGQSLGGHRASAHFKSRKSGGSNKRKKTKKKVKKKISKKKRKVIGKKESKLKRIIKTRSSTKLGKNKEKNKIVEDVDMIAPIDFDAMKNSEPDYLRHFDVSFKQIGDVNENKIVRNAYMETDGLPEVSMNDNYDLNDDESDEYDEFDLNEKYLDDDDLCENDIDGEDADELMVNNGVFDNIITQKDIGRITRSKKKKVVELKSDKDCPGRHGLIETVTADNRVCVCVECNKIMYLNEELYRCKWCDYDLCVNCFKGETKKNDEEVKKNEENECKTMRCDYVEHDKENKNMERMPNVGVDGSKNNKKRKRENEKNENKNKNNTKSAPTKKRRKLIIKIPRLRKKTQMCNKT
eukprot:272798_1